MGFLCLNRARERFYRMGLRAEILVQYELGKYQDHRKAMKWLLLRNPSAHQSSCTFTVSKNIKTRRSPSRRWAKARKQQKPSFPLESVRSGASEEAVAGSRRSSHQRMQALEAPLDEVVRPLAFPATSSSKNTGISLRNCKAEEQGEPAILPVSTSTKAAIGQRLINVGGSDPHIVAAVRLLISTFSDPLRPAVAEARFLPAADA